MSAASRFILLLSAFLFLSPTLLAQKSRLDLEKEKTENLRKLREAQKILKQTSRQKRNSVGQVKALQRQIESQVALINTYKSELTTIDSEITESNGMINSLEADLMDLKEEYASMVHRADKVNRGFTNLTFLFSAQTFNQLLMRMKYLEQYTKARKDQVAEIEKVKKSMDRQMIALRKKQQEQQELLEKQVLESDRLVASRKRKSAVIVQLSKKEKTLKNELAKRKKAAKKLDNLIAALIRKEMEASTRANGKFALTPEAAKISTSFHGNKNKLTWPVSRGFISGKFGVQPHPVLKGVKIENPGVDIQTQENEPVRCVFDGEVSKIASIPGMNGVVVIIQHGEYRTVYANLKQATVKVGDKVASKDPIGEVFTDGNGISEVQFQIWRNFDKLNPQAWLHPK
ncbi:MAG: murein hydrolase activator EnvC family protein [Cyclobacteriaceae bacterium]